MSIRRAYKDVRDQIRDGDVLLFQGTSLFSRLIRRFTRSRYSHSGLAVWWNDRLFVLEATEPEVRAMPLSILVGHYPRVDLYELRTKVDRLRVVQAAQDQLGKKYAVWGIVRFARRLLERIHGGPNPRKPPDKFICSQLVAYALREGGLVVDDRDPDAFVAPEDLAKSPALGFMGQLA